MLRALGTIAAFSLAGCASIAHHDSQVLYLSYGRYSMAIADNSIVARRNELFTPAALAKIDVTSEKETVALKLGRYVGREASHYESIDRGLGCLTINGYEKGGERVSLFLQFRHQQGAWLVDDSFLYYLPSESRFLEKPLCPEEAQREVMNDFMK